MHMGINSPVISAVLEDKYKSIVAWLNHSVAIQGIQCCFFFVFQAAVADTLKKIVWKLYIVQLHT